MCETPYEEIATIKTVTHSDPRFAMALFDHLFHLTTPAAQMILSYLPALIP